MLFISFFKLFFDFIIELISSWPFSTDKLLNSPKAFEDHDCMHGFVFIFFPFLLLVGTFPTFSRICSYCTYILLTCTIYIHILWTPAYTPGDGQTSRVYFNNSVLHLYVNFYVTVNKPVLSYLLLRLLPQW